MERKWLTASRGWAVLGLGVVAYEMSCPQGELLSEGVDRAIERHPVLTLGSIAIVAAHLANLLPNEIDPIHKLADVVGRYKDGA